MVPLEVGVAEVRGMEGGDVDVHNAFREHFAPSFPARLLPCCYVKCVFILAMVLSV